MSISPGTYRIRNVMSNTVFDCACEDESAPIHGWSQHNQSNQHWFIQPSESHFHIKNVESGLFAYIAGVHNGSKLRGSDYPSEWDILQIDDAYFIAAPGTNHAVDLDMGRSADGTIVHLWDRTDARNQKWYFEKLNDNSGGGYPHQAPPQRQQYLPQQPCPISPGTYGLKNVKTGVVLDLRGSGTDEGTDILGYNPHGGDNQKWQLQPTGRGQSMTLRNLKTKTYASFPGQSIAHGVYLQGSSQPQHISPMEQPAYVLDLIEGLGRSGSKAGSV